MLMFCLKDWRPGPLDALGYATWPAAVARHPARLPVVTRARSELIITFTVLSVTAFSVQQ